jgi:hypothetical protein
VGYGLDTSEKLVRAGYVVCFALALGAVGPWVQAGPVTASGVDGDGLYTLLFAIMAAFVFWRWSQFPQQEVLIGIMIIGAASLALAGFNAYDLRHALDAGAVEIAWGLILTLAASVAMIGVAAWLNLLNRG